MTGIWELGTSNVTRPQVTPLVSAPGVRFPGVGVLPGVPTGAGVKPKGPGRSPQPSWNAGVGSGLAPARPPAHPLGPQPYRAPGSEANLRLNQPVNSVNLNPLRLIWASRSSPGLTQVSLCFLSGAGAFGGIPGECPVSLACPSLPSQACSSQPWSPHTRRCLRASQAPHSPLPGCPGALPSLQDWWQLWRGLQVRVCCWFAGLGGFGGQQPGVPLGYPIKAPKLPGKLHSGFTADEGSQQCQDKDPPFPGAEARCPQVPWTWQCLCWPWGSRTEPGALLCPACGSPKGSCQGDARGLALASCGQCCASLQQL